MSHQIEAGGAAGRHRTSGIVLCRNVLEVEQNPVLFNQAAWLSARFAVSPAYARVIAEHAFQNGGAA